MHSVVPVERMEDVAGGPFPAAIPELGVLLPVLLPLEQGSSGCGLERSPGVLPAGLRCLCLPEPCQPWSQRACELWPCTLAKRFCLPGKGVIGECGSDCRAVPPELLAVVWQGGWVPLGSVSAASVCHQLGWPWG